MAWSTAPFRAGVNTLLLRACKLALCGLTCPQSRLPCPFAASMGCDCETHSKLCAISTGLHPSHCKVARALATRFSASAATFVQIWTLFGIKCPQSRLPCPFAASMSTVKHIRSFAQSRQVSIPPTARRQELWRQGSRPRHPHLFRFALCLGSHFGSLAPAAPPLRHEHELQLSEHSCALRASLLGSPFQILRGIRNYI